MALTQPQTDELERWTGTLSDPELVVAERRLAVYGSGAVVALEMMERRHNLMLSEPAVINAVGDVSASWVKNLDKLQDKIDQLRNRLAGNLDGLNDEAQAFVSPDGSSGLSKVNVHEYAIDNARP